MIRFNFLPWREDQRFRKKNLFMRQLMLFVLLGLTIGGVAWIINQAKVERQAERNALLKAEINQLDIRLREIASLKRDIEALQARQRAVEALESGRHQPVHILQQLSDEIPEGVMLKSLTQGDQMLLSGFALSNAGVSELLRNLNPERTQLQTAQPELMEIKSASFGEGKEARKLFEFMIVLPAASSGEKP